MANGNGANGNGHVPWYFRALEKYGLPTVALVVVFWQVIIPLKDGALDQMNRQAIQVELQTAEAKKQTELTATLTENYGIIADAVVAMKAAEQQQVSILQRIDLGLDQQREALESIEEAVKAGPQ